ncbi:DHH family phosphoesterase [Pseudoramibacter alactolyticus]|uniref:DHH family phosphoesterase n=1 Tax=Pseudoramibacter alactolyticus TaxID=113287 RepID=UPI0028D17285|nr:DHH family phosphoesterase [Pseudoramibacter alactolyticus]
MMKFLKHFNVMAIIAVIISLLLIRYNHMAGVVMLVLAVFVAGLQGWENDLKAEREEESYKAVSRQVAKINRDRMYEMPSPSVVVDGEGVCLIPNRAFIRTFGRELGKKGVQIFETLKIKPENGQKLDGSFRELAFQEHWYTLVISAFTHGNQSLYLLNFNDITHLKQLEARYRHSQTVFAYIQIDNYDDISEQLTVQERSILLGKIDVILVQWAQRNGAIIQKYENNHYLAVFNRDALMIMEREHFHLLDEIRDVSMENLPVTLSIGIGLSDERKSIQDADAMSRSALDVALARGGDQCVVSMDDKNAYYGGKTEAKEKRTKVKARIKAHALRDQMVDAHNVVIMGHQTPDMDCLGSAVGLMGACRNLNRECRYVLKEINTSIRSLIDYLSKDEHYAHAFVTPQEVRDFVEEGTLLIVVDTQNFNYVEMPELLDQVSNVVVIDHHRASGKSISDTIFSYLEAYASSTCELVTELLQYFDNKDIIKTTEANALLAGMCMDTKMFTVKTGVRTFEAASFLKRKGADTVIAKTLLQNDIETYAARSEAVTNAEFYDNTIAISLYENHTENAKLIAAQAADELLNIRGIGASFIVLKTEGGIFISGRSMGDVNVQMILEKLGGGGHMTMAGAQLHDIEDLHQARGLLVDAIEFYKKESASE